MNDEMFFHIHCHAGLEFQGGFVLVDGDFFNQLPDNGSSYSVMAVVCFLKESTHISNVFFQFIPFDAYQPKLLLFFQQAVNLATHFIIINFGTGKFYKPYG